MSGRGSGVGGGRSVYKRHATNKCGVQREVATEWEGRSLGCGRWRRWRGGWEGEGEG